jgi:threonine/homoserine/homoserine lactone efflux protein
MAYAGTSLSLQKHGFDTQKVIFMMTITFLKGMAIGFLISLPVGPIAVLCIHRTLNEGRIHGMISGLGAATADVIYGFLAASGLSFISNFLIKEQLWFRLLGGLFLCYMGIRLFRSKLIQKDVSEDSTSYFSNYVSALFLTLSNPSTFLALAAIFASLGVTQTRVHHVSVGLLVSGVFIGSGLWWFILNIATGVFLKQLDYIKLAWLNRISGIVIAGFGVLVLVSLIL